MKRFAKWALWAAAAVVILVAAAAVALPYLIDTPRVRALITTSASQALGRPLKFASLSIALLPLPAVELGGLEIAEDPQFGKEPFLRLESGRVRLRLRPLLTGKVELGAVTLRKPVITVIQNADGRMNVATLGGGPEPRGGARPAPRGGGAAGPPAAVLGSRVEIDGGTVTYIVRGKGGALTRYRVEDLDLDLTGGGTQLGFKGGARVKPGDLALKVSDGVLSLDGARNLIEAPVSAKVAIESKDVSELVRVLAGPAPAIGGAIRGTLALGGTLGAPTASGDVEFTRLAVTQEQPKCPDPKRRTLTLPTVKMATAWQDHRLTGKPLSARLGDGTITTQLTVTVNRGVRVQLADLGIRALPLEKVLVDYLCQGYAITGPLDVTGALSFGAADALGTLTGPGTLRIGPGRVVGAQALALVGGVVQIGGAVSALLSADLPANLFSSPLEFDSISGTYQITNGVVSTRDLLYTSRAMTVAIAGTYALVSGAMDLDMVVKHGRGEIKAKIAGTAASPSIRVVPSTILREVDRGKVERGLGDLFRRFR